MKRFLISLLCTALLFVCFADYAMAVSADDIYIAEPVNFTNVEFGRSFLAANIKNFGDNSLYFTISRQKNSVDSSLVKEHSSISQLRLTVPTWTTPVGTICPLGLNSMTADDYADYAVETIEQYFFFKEKVEELQDDGYAYYSENYRLEVASAYELYKTRYKFLFEDVVFADVVDGPSYCTDLGDLEVGEYIIRFLDADSALIKEFTMVIVEPFEEELEPIEENPKSIVAPMERVVHPMDIWQHINVIETTTYEVIDRYDVESYSKTVDEGRIEPKQKMD